MALYKPKYKDESGKEQESKFWWLDLTIKGKRYRESTGITRKTAAIEFEKKRRKQLEDGLSGISSAPLAQQIHSVREMVKKYLAQYANNHRKNSVTYATARLAHVTRLLGNVLLAELTEDRIHDYIRVRLAEGSGGRTINMELGELSRAIGHKWSILWPKLRKLEENEGVGQALSPEDESRLLATAAADPSPNRNPALYPFLCIALATGARSGEIANLRWSQINLDSAMLTIGKAKTKRGTGRQIPINDDLRAVLDEHARWYLQKLGEIRPEWYVFPGRAGKPTGGEKRPLDPTRPVGDITTAWDTLRERTGIQCRLHDLRHTVATKMAENGVPESTMLALLGHMSRAMLEKYSHIRKAAKVEAVKVLALPKVGPRPVSTATSKDRQESGKKPEIVKLKSTGSD